MIQQRLKVHGKTEDLEVDVFLPVEGAEFAAQRSLHPAAKADDWVVVHLRSTAKIPRMVKPSRADALGIALLLHTSCPSASLVELADGDFHGDVPPLKGPAEDLAREVRAALDWPPALSAA